MHVLAGWLADHHVGVGGHDVIRLLDLTPLREILHAMHLIGRLRTRTLYLVMA
jgi:hypothetical protein